MDLVKALIGIAVFGIGASTTWALPCSTDRWEPFIAEAMLRTQVDARWIRAVMRAESAGCEFLDGIPTTSSAGAMGLMQLMPVTWQEQRERLELGSDPYDPHDNILAGASYLRWLLDRYGRKGFIAAYHAGPGRYEELLAEDQSLPPSTIEYVARVEEFASNKGWHDASQPLAKPLSIGSLFVTLRHRSNDAQSGSKSDTDVQSGDEL